VHLHWRARKTLRGVNERRLVADDHADQGGLGGSTDDIGTGGMNRGAVARRLSCRSSGHSIAFPTVIRGREFSFVALTRGVRHPDSVVLSARRPATEADFFAIPDDERNHELLDSEIVERATPSGEHSNAQSGIVRLLGPPFQRRGGNGGGPGGWWIYTEAEIRLPAGKIVRPDVCGWRRERAPEAPRGTPIDLRPNWVCEVVSPAKPNHDLVRKLNLYLAAEIEHYWTVDPRDETLTVHRRGEGAWVLVMRAERSQTVRAEPFDAIDFPVGVLFGDDPP